MKDEKNYTKKALHAAYREKVNSDIIYGINPLRSPLSLGLKYEYIRMLKNKR